jgi:hypothetical protein
MPRRIAGSRSPVIDKFRGGPAVSHPERQENGVTGNCHPRPVTGLSSSLSASVVPGASVGIRAIAKIGLRIWLGKPRPSKEARKSAPARAQIGPEKSLFNRPIDSFEIAYARSLTPITISR